MTNGIDSHDASQSAQELVALLWGPEPTGTRGPKPALTRTEVVEAAIHVADTAGFGGLSMQAIADRLDVSTTGLYRYVSGKPELVALMTDHAAGETVVVDEPAAGWRQRLEHFARGLWSMYHRHPWMLDVPMGRMVPGPNSTARYDAGLAAALLTGLPPAEVVAICEAVYQLVVGAARASTENIRITRESGVSYTDWWSGQSELTDVQPILTERFPALAAIIESGAFDEDGPWDDGTDGFNEMFERTLKLMLDGISAQIEQSEATSRPTGSRREPASG